MSSSATPATVAEIALPTRVADGFDYLIPAGLAHELLPGCRVEVGFGHRRMIGVVTALKSGSDHPAERLKTIERIIDSQPVIDAALMQLLRRAAGYYHHPLGEVIFTALPRRLREGGEAVASPIEVWRPTTGDDQQQTLRRAPKQLAVLHLLQASDSGLTASEIGERIPSPHDALRALRKKGLIDKGLRKPRRATPVGAPSDQPPELTSEQRAALRTLLTDNQRFRVDLLDGVTGSGKTEVYLNLIAPLLEAGRQVLVLVPEISLTPQLRSRFEARFPGRVASYHSGLNDGERMAVWRGCADGETGIVLGTRSAVFLPLTRPGAIIVDEEHDPSLKQGEGFRYHARDLAIFRGQIDNCPVLLGSATPSLETLANVERGRYGCVRLTTRAGNARPPTLHLVNLRRQQLLGGLSALLVEKMREHLANGRQVLLFINRRGYAPALLCHECGYLVDCLRCNAHMTWHATSNALRCHHCGHSSRPPPRCPACGHKALHPVGVGTQKIEDVVAECFPEHPTIRIDRDSMDRKHALEEALRDVRDGRYDIIIGTQMLAKGHDFPNITLVGMIDVDQGLFSSDYHATERVAQQILQVSGRAGRGAHAGEVVIQTTQPEHPLLQALLQQDYGAVTPALLEERRLGLWPPYRHIALFRASAHKAADASGCLDDIRALAEQLGEAALEILGPAPAPLERRAGRFRFQLILRSPSRGTLHACLDQLMPRIGKLKSARKARWSLDVDPADLG